MTNRQAGGWALIGIAIATIVIFIIHPVQIDQTTLIGPWGLNTITHAFAIAYVPLIAVGVFALAEWLGLDRPLVRVALAFNLLAVVLMMLAPLVSGFITGDAYVTGADFGRLAVSFNRAFDRGYIGFTAIAMLFNGLALPAGHRLWKYLSVPAAIGPLLWLASGSFHPDPHAMLLLAIAQGGWFLAAGRALLAAERTA